jgi:hypothetical protein
MVLAAETYLDAVRLIGAATAVVEPILTAVITLGAAISWPGE